MSDYSDSLREMFEKGKKAGENNYKQRVKEVINSIDDERFEAMKIYLKKELGLECDEK